MSQNCPGGESVIPSSCSPGDLPVPIETEGVPSLAGDAGLQAVLVEDQGCQVLRRLSRLPPELQAVVLRHLPVTDITVWKRVNRYFHDWIQNMGLQERALCRSRGRAFARAAFTQESYDHLLQPWLAGFAAFQPPRPGVRFSPAFVFAAVTRTLHQTRQLVLNQNHNFLFEGALVMRIRFSADGHYITVQTLNTMDRPILRDHILERDGQGWHKGSPFADSRGADHILFTADARRVAVAHRSGEVCIWDKPGCGDWRQQACLVRRQESCGKLNAISISSLGRVVAVWNEDRSLRIWRQTPELGWQIRAFFPVCQNMMRSAFCPEEQAVFSPDENWLLLPCPVSGQLTVYSQDEQGDWTLPVLALTPPESTPQKALFHHDGERLRLLVLLADGVLSVWELERGQWVEQAIVQHPDRITDARFSPDGQSLVIRSLSAATQLWELDAGKQWRLQHCLNQADSDMQWLPLSICFDPGSRWLMVADSLNSFLPVSFRASRLDVWEKDSTEQWRHCSGAIQELPFACTGLAAGNDGRHLAALSHTQTGCYLLSLLELNRGTWVKRAEIRLPRLFYKTVIMDPFCCCLAVISCSRTGESVDILSVQEAPPAGSANEE